MRPARRYVFVCLHGSAKSVLAAEYLARAARERVNCDPSALNSALQVTRIDQYGQPYSIISNQMPAYCTAYTGHVYTYFEGTIPKYVGLPERGGYWVDPQSYDQALAGYNQRIAQENEAARLNLYLSNMGN